MSAVAQGSSASAYRIFNGYAPLDGPKSCTVVLKFNTLGVASISADLYREHVANQINCVQAMFIDNSLNGQRLTFLFGVTDQLLKIPANTQMYTPILAVEGTPFTAATGGNVDVTVLFINVPIPFSVWTP